jgi:hypothetical protein
MEEVFSVVGYNGRGFFRCGIQWKRFFPLWDTTEEVFFRLWDTTKEVFSLVGYNGRDFFSVVGYNGRGFVCCGIEWRKMIQQIMCHIIHPPYNL